VLKPQEDNNRIIETHMYRIESHHGLMAIAMAHV